MNHSLDKMQSYDTYKPTNFELVEKIPSHWETMSLRRLFTLLTDYDANGSFSSIKDNVNRVDEETEKYAWFVRATDLESLSRDKEDDKVWVDEKTYQFLSKSKLYGGEILIAKRGEIGKIYRMPFVNFPCTLAPNLYLIRIVEKIKTDYLFFFLISNFGNEQLKIKNNSTTLGALYKDDLKDIICILPPLTEQQSIVTYLDQKTTLIDELIAKKQSKIELLKEQRKALINHAVTKGLNAEVAFKDSKIEWIGEIPEHWKIKKAKHLLEPNNGIKIGPFGSALKLDTLSEEGIKIYGQGNIIKNDFTLGERYLPIERFVEEFGQYEIFDGDVLVTMMGTTGKSKVFNSNYERGILDSHLLRLRFIPEKFISYLFTVILEQSDYVFHQLRLNSKGSIMEGLNSSIVKELIILTPPLSEQQAIVAYLDEQTALIDKNIELESQKITTLKEYRQSLISAVVTGKICVIDN